MRIFAIGDLHVDFPANRSLVAQIPETEYVDDILLVAGDVAHRVDAIGTTLSALRRRFARVFFVPGNHDLWVAGAAEDDVLETSLDRVEAIRTLCRDEGIETDAAPVGAVWIVPLLSWYEPGLDSGPGTDLMEDTDEVTRRQGRRWADRRHCRWPASLGDDVTRCRHFAQLNEPGLASPTSQPLLTFSHFCPRLDLLPSVEHLRFKHLPRVAGTPRLERQIRESGSRLHLYGHTHIPQDKVMDGVRYVNAPLGYPRERARWGREGLRLRLLVDDAMRITEKRLAEKPTRI